MLNIFYTNLGLYNEGMLSGEWISLPVSDDELSEVMNRTGYDETHEEYFITDFETDINGLTVEEYDSIEELNKLAELIDDEPEKVEALLYFGFNSAEEISEKMDDVSYICKIEGFSSMEYEVGYYYAEEVGCLDIPENLKTYFDYEAYGRDICLEGSFYEAEDGSIYEWIN